MWPFSNSSARTDRGNQLAGINAAWNVYNRGLPLADTMSQTGQATQTKGVSGLDQAKQYWQDILSGKTNVMQSASPEVNAALETADAARAQTAEMGTARGGGAGAFGQQQDFATRANLNKAIAQQRPEAAKGLESVSGKEADIGVQQLSQALQSLGLSKQVADQIINSSIASREVSLGANPLNAVPGVLVNAILSSVGL